MEIRFSRHAKNKLRLYKLSQSNVEEVIICGKRLEQGDKYESRYGTLRVIWIMIGSYALVITVINTR